MEEFDELYMTSCNVTSDFMLLVRVGDHYKRKVQVASRVYHGSHFLDDGLLSAASAAEAAAAADDREDGYEHQCPTHSDDTHPAVEAALTGSLAVEKTVISVAAAPSSYSLAVFNHLVLECGNIPSHN